MRMSNYGRESPSPGTKMGKYWINCFNSNRSTGQWQEYCSREERISKTIAMRNGQKNGTWLEDEEIKAQNEGNCMKPYSSLISQVPSTTHITSSTRRVTPERTSTTASTTVFSTLTAITIQSFTAMTGQMLNRGKPLIAAIKLMRFAI